MSATRILKRNLQRQLLAERRYHRSLRDWFFKFGERRFMPARAWVDLRPRDKAGNLAGHCSEMAAQRAKREETKRRLFGDRARPMEASA